jgi:MFS family permease
MKRTSDAWVFGIGIALFGLYSIFLVLPVMPLVLLANVIAGIGIAWVVVGIYSAIQLRSPDHLQGRVFSAIDTSLSIPQMISIALGAGLVSVVDYRILAITIAVVCGAAGLWLARRPIDPVAASGPSEVVLPIPDPPVAASDVVDPHPPDLTVETYASER